MMDQLLKNKSDIIQWLQSMGVSDYTLKIDDQYGFVVDVEGDVDLSDKDLDFLAVKFNDVTGTFNCCQNKLINLIGAPHSVGKDFQVNENQLTSLIGSPHSVGTNFICSNNRLKSLEFGPLIVGWYLLCGGNQIESFEFCPEEVDCVYCDNGIALAKGLTCIDGETLLEIQRDTLILKEKNMLSNLDFNPQACDPKISGFNRHKI